MKELWMFIVKVSVPIIDGCTEAADKAMEDLRSRWLESVEPIKLALEVVANLAGEDEDHDGYDEEVSSCSIILISFHGWVVGNLCVVDGWMD